MVSPSKYCSTPNRDYKVGNQRLKKTSVKSQGVSKLARPSSAKYQPLSKTKFYLDVRSRIESGRLESTLRFYGATVDVFLGEDVNFIITDSAEWNGNGHSPSESISPITTPSPSSQLDQSRVIPRSRASAMLEKVSRQPSSPYCSPLVLAQKWKIPVFSIPSFWEWIEKVKESVFVKGAEKKSRDTESLKSEIIIDASDSPFLKIESFLGLDKPELLELDTWPMLHLDGHLGQCPFRSPKPVTSSRSEEVEERSDSFEDKKDKVTVELIKYDTDFRIKENFDAGEYDFMKSEALLTPKTAEETFAPTKVQCNGLTTGLRNSKLLSPSGSDVLPLPTSRRSTRRASASWCGSTRELSQLSPIDGDIENIRRSESSFESNEASLDSPGITLRPKGQLWLPVALIGTTAEENGNSIRKRLDYSTKQTENAKLCSYIMDSLNGKARNNSLSNHSLGRASKGSDSSLNSNYSDKNDYHSKRNSEKKDSYCIITRNAKIKSEDMNGKSRESSAESHKSFQDIPKSRIDGKKRSLSVGGSGSVIVKRSRTVSTNSVCSVTKKKKLSPEEKLLQDNKEYFKMEVLNTKLRSSGSLLNVNQNNVELNGNNDKTPMEKIEKIIIKKIRVRGRRKRNRWTKTTDKKVSDLHCRIFDIHEKKPDLKLNGIIRKKRQSELTKLCDEAESFMFGESSRQGNVHSSSLETTSKVPGNLTEDSAKKKISKEHTDDNSVQRTVESVENEGRRRKKRRSHAEAFIHDNIDYYKFETPGSRLRYQGSFTDAKQGSKDFIYTLKEKRKSKSQLENKKLESCGVSDEVKAETDVNVDKKRYPVQPSAEIEKLLFSFENIPSMEPWYDVYKRQDEGMENYYPLLSDPCDQPFLLPYEMPKPNIPRIPEMSDYYKRKKKKLAHLFNHPRKSPRCHASTLAILSSLKKRKRRSGNNISINSVLSEYSPPNSGTVQDDTEAKHQETESNNKDLVESEDLLNFLNEGEPDEESELVFLEPLSDTESSYNCNVNDNAKDGKGDEDETKILRTMGRIRKGRPESQDDTDSLNSDTKLCSLQSVKSDAFFEDMVIETRKKSDLNISVATVVENCRYYKLDDGDVDLISELGDGSVADGLDFRRKKKKARKINKTGWDNRKARRRIGNKITETKINSDCCVLNKPKRIKTKVKLKEYGINEENIIGSAKRRLRNNIEDSRPVLRSRVDLLDRYAGLRRNSQEIETHCESIESDPADFLPSIVHSKKGNEGRLNSSVRIKCANGRYGIKGTLVLGKKRTVMDYSWTTKRR